MRYYLDDTHILVICIIVQVLMCLVSVLITHSIVGGIMTLGAALGIASFWLTRTVCRRVKRGK